MKFVSVFCFFVLLLFCQDYSVIRIDAGKMEYKLHGLSKNNIIYFSADGFARILGGRYYFNEELKKAEIKFDNYTIRAAGRNQFLVVRDKNSNSDKIYQLAISTIIAGNKLYLPALQLNPFLKIIAKKEIIKTSADKFLIKDLENQDKPSEILPVSSGKYFVNNILIEKKFNGTQILLTEKNKKFNYSISREENKIKLLLNNTTIDENAKKKIKPVGLIRTVRLIKKDSSMIMEFEVTSDFSGYDEFIDDQTGDLVIALHNSFFRKKTQEQSAVNKGKFDVIVLDPGHGGKDPGAIGVSGVKEKEINLLLAQKLGKLIESRMPGVKVVYTRNDDRFVELYKRGKIANDNNGKLFISIHCNSMPRKPNPRTGFETYLLRPGKTDEAIKIAEFENSVIKLEEDPERYKALSEENFILVSMAHSAYMRYSEKFADYLNQAMASGSRLDNLGVKQAGFYVLVGASMPGVLFEAGFLSNTKDEKYLSGDEGQDEIAESIYNAIVDYREYYEKMNSSMSN